MSEVSGSVHLERADPGVHHTHLITSQAQPRASVAWSIFLQLTQVELHFCGIWPQSVQAALMPNLVGEGA